MASLKLIGLSLALVGINAKDTKKENRGRMLLEAR
jgi:hypothetical protein